MAPTTKRNLMIGGALYGAVALGYLIARKNVQRIGCQTQKAGAPFFSTDAVCSDSPRLVDALMWPAEVLKLGGGP